MADKLTDGLASVGKIKSYQSLITGTVIGVILLCVGLYGIIKKKWSLWLLTCGLGLLILSGGYINFTFVNSSKEYAALQGAIGVADTIKSFQL